MTKSPIFRIIFTAVLFFVIALPFPEYFDYAGVTEIRPVGAFPVVFGLMFGLPGALGCAIANFLDDMVSGMGLALSAAGFVVQFIYGAVPFLLWRAIRNKSESVHFRLSHVGNLVRYMVIVLVSCTLMALMFGALMVGFDILPFFSAATLLVFLNNIVFCILLGIPIVIFISVGNLKNLSLNERLILVFLFLGAITSIFSGILTYFDIVVVGMEQVNVWNRVFFDIAANLLVYFGVAMVVLYYIEKRVAIPIDSIANIVKSTIGGAEKKDGAIIAAECEKFVGTGNEMGILAAAFKKMVLDLDAYIENLTEITAEKERIGTELEIATQIQASMLPCIFPPFPDHKEIDIFAAMTPAKEVGGDFYDFFFTDENTLALVIADVSGKGVPSALFMVIAKTLIKNNAALGKSPREVFEAVNNILCENNEACMFVTAFMGYLDLRSREFTYVNAGHNPPLVTSSGAFKFLTNKPEGVLAFIEDRTYEEYKITLAAGDALYLYTDGVTEATNNNFELFSDARLLEKANLYAGLPARGLIESLESEVHSFADGAEQSDDITMLALRLLPRSP